VAGRKILITSSAIEPMTFQLVAGEREMGG
jgi:hypothetical protein